MSIIEGKGIRFVLEFISACIVWTLKGFKGKLTDEMSGPRENNKKTTRNFLISIIILIIIFLVFRTIYIKNSMKESNNEKAITFKPK